MSTPELLERDRSDSDDSETDESRPKFANPEGIYILILNVEVSYGTQFAINVIGDKRNNIIFILVFPNPTNPTEDTTFYHRDDSGMATVEVDTLSVSSYHNNG